MKLKRWFMTLPLRLRSLFRQNRVELELDEEIRFHLDRQAGQFAEGGLDPQEAQRAAIREFKGVELRKEECRDARG